MVIKESEVEEKKPLVSIIVRTKDRPKLLKNALKSIASQTYRPIEVVLVNDGGCELDIEEIKSILGDVTLNYIRLEKNTGRAHAGNVGIENAKGEYIGFLDDDDELYPEHVETHVSFLNKSEYMVAYSTVEFVKKIFDENNNCLIDVDKNLFSEKDYSYDEILITNYIPLISLLFRSALKKEIMFDESLEIFEDWDMLIRVGKENKFYFINRVTAKYNQWSDSQIAFVSPPEFIKQAAIKIYTKHRDKFTPSLIYRLCIEEWANRPEVKELQEIMHQKDEEIQFLQIQLTEKEQILQAILSSRGWQFLEKYRRMKNKIKMLFA